MKNNEEIKMLKKAVEEGKNPKYVNVNSGSKSATPKNLNQTYCIVNQEDKLNFLFSFFRVSHQQLRPR